MTNPWQIYDELIAPIEPDVTVAAAAVGPKWCRVASSDGGVGAAYAFPEGSRPRLRSQTSLVGAPLREVAELAKSWNFVEAGIGVAAINAWHCRADSSAAAGFMPCAANNWGQVFHPYSDAVAGKRVAVVGHFPFAPEPLIRAAELVMLERTTQAGDYPDSACEYVLPESDYVFISGSSFVNKTLPRLLQLARHATTVVLGPSTPVSTTLFEHGADVVTGFVPSSPAELFTALGSQAPSDMYAHGHRVERHR